MPPATIITIPPPISTPPAQGGSLSWVVAFTPMLAPPIFTPSSCCCGTATKNDAMPMTRTINPIQNSARILFLARLSRDQKNQQNDQDDKQPAARVIAPATTIGPSWKCSNNQQ